MVAEPRFGSPDLNLGFATPPPWRLLLPHPAPLELARC